MTVSRRFRIDGRDTVCKNGALDRRFRYLATVPARRNGCRNSLHRPKGRAKVAFTRVLDYGKALAQ